MKYEKKYNSKTKHDSYSKEHEKMTNQWIKGMNQERNKRNAAQTRKMKRKRKKKQSPHLSIFTQNRT